MRGLAFTIMVLLFFPVSSLASQSLAIEKKVIIGFHQMPGWAEENLVREKMGKIRRHFKKLKILAATLPETEIIKLKNDPRVAYIESDAVVQAVEPFFGAEYDMAWGVRQIGSQVSHENSFMGSAVNIAILDTGMDYHHPELSSNYQGGTDLVNNDNDPMDDSINGHGTHLAGIIAAELNGTGVVGVAPQASLYAVKVLNGGGMGSLSDVIAGIDWAIDNGMEIINLSLGINDDFTSLREACDRAYREAGILLIAAAGNTSGTPATFPAAYDSVIAVNGTDADGNPGWFAALDSAVELTAPGVSIVSTTTGNTYTSFDGTSQAAAHVTGAAALLMAAGTEDLNADGRIADDVRLQLQSSAADLGPPGHDDIYGFGRVDIARALNLPDSAPDPPPEDPIIIEIRRGDGTRQYPLSAGHYQISIVNNGLKRLKITTFDSNGRRTGQRKTVFFTGSNQKFATCTLDITGEPGTIALTPAGISGSFARITLMPATQEIPYAESGKNKQLRVITRGNSLPF